MNHDRLRQLTVTLAEIFCIVGTLVGFGVIGTRVQDAASGTFAATATLLAPATRAFSIWSVIYLGLACYTVWQWLPSATTNPRARATGWLAAASLVLNAAWILVTQQGWVWLSVVVIVALLACLAVLVARLGSSAGAGRFERIALDGTFGLYLGWVAVATCANVTAALVASGVRPGAAIETVLAVAVVLVAGAVGVFLARRLGGRWAVAVAMAWGLAWIAVGRLTAGPISTPTAIAAVVAALAALAAPALPGARMPRARHPLGRGPVASAQ